MSTEGATESRNTAAADDVAHLLVRCLRAEGVDAESFGARGYRVESADQLLPVLRRALEDEGVSVIACPVDYTENLRLTDRRGSLSGPF